MILRNHILQIVDNDGNPLSFKSFKNPYEDNTEHRLVLKIKEAIEKQ